MKILMLTLSFLLFLNCLFAQQTLSRQLNSEDSLMLRKLLRIELSEFVCKKAKTVFMDNQLKEYKKIELMNSGSLGNYKGFLLYYSDKIYLRIEVRNSIPFSDPEKSKEWYLTKLKNEKVATIIIPPHLLYEQ